MKIASGGEMNTNNPMDIVDSFEPFPPYSYEGLDLAGMAVYAIHKLQILAIPVTFENLVVSLFRLFPTKFCLEGYNQYPDAARVGRTLLQLGPKYRNWARGSVQKGFTLTQSGTAKVEKMSSLLMSGEPSLIQLKRQQRPRTMDINKELLPLEKSILFQEWKNENLNKVESTKQAVEAIIDMLGAYAYTPPKALRGRIQRLQQLAIQAGRDDLVNFLIAVKHEFSSLFAD